MSEPQSAAGVLEAPELHSPSDSEPPPARPPRGRKRWLVVTLLLAASALVALGVDRFRGAAPVSQLPTAPARQGEFLVIVRCRGEIRARRSTQVSAPVNVPELRIVWLARSGDPVKKGDAVIRFDPSSARQQLNEKDAELERAQASLEQAVAQARITAEQDRLDLARASYEVEKAKLEVSKSEIISALQAEEKRIELLLAERKLRVQQATVELHEASDRAKVASLTQVRDQAQAEVNLTNERLARMDVTAPGDGIIVYLPNYSQGWMNAQPFKVGDQVWPGAPIAEIPDLATLEMEAKLEEMDRGRVAAGNDARVRIDALPELALPAKLVGISPLTQQGFEWPPTRTFRGYAPIEEGDARLRPGMNGSLDIVVNRLPEAVSVPAKALFTDAGKPIVYLATEGGYHAAAVEILARNPDEVAISGIEAGALVALVEPEEKERTP
jgi:multidrug efflux pump subunit AcrA (membrane-fusion protein)